VGFGVLLILFGNLQRVSNLGPYCTVVLFDVSPAAFRGFRRPIRAPAREFDSRSFRPPRRTQIALDDSPGVAHAFGLLVDFSAWGTGRRHGLLGLRFKRTPGPDPRALVRLRPQCLLAGAGQADRCSSNSAVASTFPRIHIRDTLT